MKLKIIFFIMLALNNVFSYEYEGILNFLSVGSHIGKTENNEDCKVTINLSQFGQISRLSVYLSINDQLSQAFNKNILEHDEEKEYQTENSYEASFIELPDDGYTGKYYNYISIVKTIESTTVKIMTSKRLFGRPIGSKPTICTISN
jgi:hypothetical protein